MEKERKKYYKVIRKKSRNSAVITNRKVLVKYPLNTWVKPLIKGTKLMIFEFEKNAISWAYSMEHQGYVSSGLLIIVPCYIMNPKKTLLVCDDINAYDLVTEFKKFWKKITYIRKRHNDFDALKYFTDPRYILGLNDSYECSAVKCLE